MKNVCFEIKKIRTIIYEKGSLQCCLFYMYLCMYADILKIVIKFKWIYMCMYVCVCK